MSSMKAAKAISGYFKRNKDEPEDRDASVEVEDETFAQRVARKLKKRMGDQTDKPAQVNAKY